MMISGHTEETIRQAVAALNEHLDNNITIRELKRHGKTGRSKYLDVRLGVAATRDKGGRILAGVATRRHHGYAQSRDGLAAVSAASWDAHGMFFAALYNANPDTVIRTGSIAYGSTVLKSRDDLRRHWR